MDKRQQRSNNLEYIQGEYIKESQSAWKKTEVSEGSVRRQSKMESVEGELEGYLNNFSKSWVLYPLPTLAARVQCLSQMSTTTLVSSVFQTGLLSYS